jgi:hypothetical protein
VGKPEGKRALGRPIRRWEDNIKVDFGEAEGNVGRFLSVCTTGGSQGSAQLRRLSCLTTYVLYHFTCCSLHYS